MRVRFVTTLEQDLIKKLRISAAKQDKNMNDLLEELIKTLDKED